MKTIAIEDNRPIGECLPANDDAVVCLTVGGKTRFVVLPFDEGDEEVAAIQQNDKLMRRISEFIDQARREKGKTLSRIKEELGIV